MDALYNIGAPHELGNRGADEYGNPPVHPNLPHTLARWFEEEEITRVDGDSSQFYLSPDPAAPPNALDVYNDLRYSDLNDPWARGGPPQYHAGRGLAALEHPRPGAAQASTAREYITAVARAGSGLVFAVLYPDVSGGIQLASVARVSAADLSARGAPGASPAWTLASAPGEDAANAEVVVYDGASEGRCVLRAAFAAPGETPPGALLATAIVPAFEYNWTYQVRALVVQPESEHESNLKEELPPPLSGTAIVADADRLVLFGGASSESHIGSSSAFYSFTFADGKWRAIDNTFTPWTRRSPTAFTRMPRTRLAFMLGGRTEDEVYHDAWELNLDTLEWRDATPSGEDGARDVTGWDFSPHAWTPDGFLAFQGGLFLGDTPVTRAPESEISDTTLHPEIDPVRGEPFKSRMHREADQQTLTTGIEDTLRPGARVESTLVRFFVPPGVRGLRRDGPGTVASILAGGASKVDVGHGIMIENASDGTGILTSDTLDSRRLAAAPYSYRIRPVGGNGVVFEESAVPDSTSALWQPLRARPDAPFLGASYVGVVRGRPHGSLLAQRRVDHAQTAINAVRDHAFKPTWYEYAVLGRTPGRDGTLTQVDVPETDTPTRQLALAPPVEVSHSRTSLYTFFGIAAAVAVAAAIGGVVVWRLSSKPKPRRRGMYMPPMY